MNKKIFATIGQLALVVNAIFASLASGQDRHWISPAGGDFGKIENWTWVFPAPRTMQFSIWMQHTLSILKTMSSVLSLEQFAGDVTFSGGYTLTTSAESLTDATLTLSGFGTNYFSTADFLVGTRGTGVLNIESGSVFTNARASLGLSDGSTGTVNVNGTGSIWNNDNLFLGAIGPSGMSDGGVGMINATANGMVYVGDDRPVISVGSYLIASDSGSDPGEHCPNVYRVGWRWIGRVRQVEHRWRFPN